jgi:hypothetical protein
LFPFELVHNWVFEASSFSPTPHAFYIDLKKRVLVDFGWGSMCVGVREGRFDLSQLVGSSVNQDERLHEYASVQYAAKTSIANSRLLSVPPSPRRNFNI